MSPPPAGTGQDAPPQRARGPQQRTTPRAQLGQRAHFAEISPEVGALDEQAFADAMRADPDAALTLLVEMGAATDERLRAAARSLAARVVLDRARSGIPRRGGIGRLRRQSAELGGDLDVDASLDGLLEARAARRRPTADSLVAVDWGRPELALVLLVLIAFVLFEPLGLYGRWLKLRTYLQIFPFYRKGMFQRQKSYLKSDRLK